MLNNTILQSVLKGKILPWQAKSVTTKAYTELSKRIDAEHEYFKQFISEDDKLRFNRYHAMITEQLGIESDITDYNMFVLGINIGLEITEHKQSLIDECGGLFYEER